MADIADALTQEQVADSLVGEPDAGAQEAQPEEQQDAGQQVEEQVTEGADDWLPTEQEKVYPDEVLSRYAQRYNLDENSLTNPSLRQLLIDKINSDVFIREQQQQPEFEPEAEPQSQPQQPVTPPTVQQWLGNAQQFIRQTGLNNPEMSKAFAQQFMSAFGVQDVSQVNAEALAETFAVFGMNLINSVLPMYFQAPSPTEGRNMLQHFMESNYDGLGAMAEGAAYRTAWNSVRQASPELAKMTYGSEEFSAMMEKAEEAMPGLQWMKFADERGHPLSPSANAKRQYEIAVRISQGQRLSPQMARQAVETGRREARQQQVRLQSGSLGSGRSNQQLQQGDDFWSNPESWNQFLDRKL